MQAKKKRLTVIWSPYSLNFVSVFPNGRLAQPVEHLTFNQGVIGSIPIAPTILHGGFYNPQFISHSVDQLQSKIKLQECYKRLPGAYALK